MSGRLEDEIKALIAAEGPMPVSRFMALALGHPRLGYYVTRDPFGAGGDFVTAPEISQMFGELVGLWAVAQWQAMGAPAPFALVELGPGRGTLMADALRAARLVPEFGAAARLHLVEMSPTLRAAQGRALGAAAPQWHDRLEDVPPGPMIAIANEFFDAIPIDQFVFRDGRWRARRVGLKADGALAFGLDPLPHGAEPAPYGPPAEGAVLERMVEGPALALAGRIAGQGGAALVVDYGHAGGYGDTLQAVRAHRWVDPLADPGEADLTAHVDFAALARRARASGARAFGPIGQGEFLARLGLAQRATRLKAGKDAAAQAAVDAAALRLAGHGEGQMGALFKAMVIAHGGLGAPVAFDTGEEVV
ncbi:SAM-dependent methyltransferase [Xanthobacter sp. KR7-225]|uniref:class I SAM-dependent methyltransferase n=1 Tax=Xanthobacter sp. KR7-225 TaxID=3156613 RepID=UPI0032B3DBC9